MSARSSMRWRRDQSLYAYKIDATSGALDPVSGSPFVLGAAPTGIAFNPAGGFAFVASRAVSAAGGGGIHVFAVGATSGVPQEVTGSPFFPTLFGGALVMHPSGKFLYDSFGGVHAYLIDPVSGHLDEIAGSPHPGASSDNQAIDIALDPSGHSLYATDTIGTVTAYTIDTASGAFGPVAGSPIQGQTLPYSIAVDPRGGFVYVGNDDEKISVFSILPVSGALQPVGEPFTVHGLQPEIAVIGP